MASATGGGMPAPSATDLVWLAGIIEGEGSIGNTRPDHIDPRVTVLMTDLDVIETVQRIAGVGTIARNNQCDRKKEAWEWACYGDNARWLAGLLFPHMHSRRQQRILDMAA